VNPDAEASLMLLAIGLYVYDTAILLQSNEFLVMERTGGQWLALFGSNVWKLSGKEPALPGLVMPWRPVVKVRWDLECGLSGEASGGNSASALPDIGWGPKAGVTLVMGLIFVALPACLFIYPYTPLTVTVGVLIYLCCAASMVALGLQREALGLSRADCWKLALEAVACPPFCINAVRKASLRSRSTVSAGAVAQRLGEGEALQALKRAMLVRVREQIEIEPEGSARLARLEHAASALQGARST
jgi:hypothetical protein